MGMVNAEKGRCECGEDIGREMFDSVARWRELSPWGESEKNGLALRYRRCIQHR